MDHIDDYIPFVNSFCKKVNEEKQDLISTKIQATVKKQWTQINTLIRTYDDQSRQLEDFKENDNDSIKKKILDVILKK